MSCAPDVIPPTSAPSTAAASSESLKPAPTAVPIMPVARPTSANLQSADDRCPGQSTATPATDAATPTPVKIQPALSAVSPTAARTGTAAGAVMAIAAAAAAKPTTAIPVSTTSFVVGFQVDGSHQVVSPVGSAALTGLSPAYV